MVSPSIFLFSNKLEFQKALRVPLFTILKTSRFLNLRYSADFGRSRLVNFVHTVFHKVLNYCKKTIMTNSFHFLCVFLNSTTWTKDRKFEEKNVGSNGNLLIERVFTNIQVEKRMDK